MQVLTYGCPEVKLRLSNAEKVCILSKAAYPCVVVRVFVQTLVLQQLLTGTLWRTQQSVPPPL